MLGDLKSCPYLNKDADWVTDDFNKTKIKHFL